MDKKRELQLFRLLTKIVKVMQGVKQASWSIDQTKHRYPNPEDLTPEEMEELLRNYLAFVVELKSLAEEGNEIYGEYNQIREDNGKKG